MTQPVKTIIIGGGLAGVATLYALSRRGEAVLLLEAHEDIAFETSFANGGMLTASAADPWNSPGVGRHLASSLFNPHAAIKLHLREIPQLMSWGLTFLRNSSRVRHRETTLKNFRLAAHSVRKTREVTEALGLQYDQTNNGAMKVFERKTALAEPLALAQSLVPHGLRFEVLDRDGVMEKEPALRGAKSAIAGGIYFPDDSAGDARTFTKALAAHALNNGSEIKTGVKVMRVLTNGAGVSGVETAGGVIESARVVIAAGNASPFLARPFGLHLPIRPAKGYSVTVDAGGWRAKPAMPVIDDAMHIAISPLGDRLRLVGTAEFAGEDRSIDRRRIANLFKLFERLYPELAAGVDREAAKEWAGLRPMSADGLAFIGSGGPEGLWVNAGHGHLGWTLAMGSADILADQMLGEPPAIDPAPFRPGR